MKLLETMNTKIIRGDVVNSSPRCYTVKSKNVEDCEILNIPIQKGSVNEPNGVFIEDLILICIDQLEHYQQTEFACEENERTLVSLKNALDTTRSRQYERIIRGVQGKYVK